MCGPSPTELSYLSGRREELRKIRECIGIPIAEIVDRALRYPNFMQVTLEVGQQFDWVQLGMHNPSVLIFVRVGW
jgi:hypothetical protein